MPVDSPSRLTPLLFQAAQAQKHITVNESLWQLDAIVQSAVLSRTSIMQPLTTSAQDSYILPESLTGANWSGYTAGELLIFGTRFARGSTQ